MQTTDLIKVNELSLKGLLQLQEEGVLSTNGEDATNSSSWPVEQVRFDPSSGHVISLDLGSKRFRKGIPCLESFAHFEELKCLNLGGTDAPFDETLQVAQILANTLEEVYLGGNSYGSAERLAELLSGTKKITKLDLRYSDMSSIGLKKLLSGESIRKVKFLHLEGNDIQDLESLANLLNDPACELQEVYLGANRIQAEGAAQLASCLSSNQCLTKIYLEGNSIGEDGAQAFIDALESGNGVLKHLYVDNNNIGKDASQRLAKALNSSTAIGESLLDQ